MLVLHRGIGQSVIIKTAGGEVITVTVTQLRNREGQMRLGFEAPPSVAIWRAEIAEKKSGEKK